MPYMFNEDKTKANIIETTLKATSTVNIPANGHDHVSFPKNYPGTLLSVRRDLNFISRKNGYSADWSKIIFGDISVSTNTISYIVYNNNDYEITVQGGASAGPNVSTLKVVSVG